MNIPPAAKTALLLIAGILAGRLFPFPFHPFWFWPASILVFAMILIGLTGKGPAWGPVVLVFLMGWTRFSAAQWQPHNDILHLIDKPGITLKAHLMRDPSTRPERVRYHLSVDSVHTRQGFTAVTGRCLLTLYDAPGDTLFYGDEIQVCGILHRPPGRRNPGGFNYRDYLNTRKTAAILQINPETPVLKTGAHRGSFLLANIIYPVRRKIAWALESIYQNESEGLMKALILGDRTDLDVEIRNQFSQIGIVHVLAVSGLHVGFVLLILQTLFGLIRIPHKWQPVFVIAGLVLYTLITESNPPVVRAAFMASLYLAGKALQRKNNAYNTLGTAALLLLLINPRMLFDAGFQLSFTAVLSILWLTPRWQRLPGFGACDRWCRSRALRGIWLLFLVSLSAQVGTLPVTVTLFNKIPLTGILANLYAVPLTGLIVAYGFVSLLAAAIHPWLAGIFGGCAALLSRILMVSAQWMHNHCELLLTAARPHPLLILCYLLVIFLIFTENTAARRRLIFTVLILINILVWRSAATEKPGLTWVQLDVGQGDAAVVHLPRGQTLLIDGGDRTPWFDAGKRVVIPYLMHKGIRTIDALILTHGHNDHAGGLISVLNQFNIKQIFLGDTLTRSQPFQEFYHTARQLKIPVTEITAPDSLRFAGSRLYFISPDSVLKHEPNSNNRSLVTLIIFGNHRFLCMGDAEQTVESHLLETTRRIAANMIKIGHHGSSTSSSRAFLEETDPEHAIISVAAKNRFNHPSPATLRALADLNIHFLRTDEQGAVVLHSDGGQLHRMAW